MNADDYELLDAGDGRKLERFGEVILARPCAQAVWSPQHPDRWARANATFDREDGNRWDGRGSLPDHWIIHTAGIGFHLATTDFGHLGIFPEQRAQWEWIRATCRTAPGARVLNLFAYSGGASMAAAQGGAKVTHLDASKGMVQWASENADLNDIFSIRWIVDDAIKFLRREARRGNRYDGIILDPPTYGRGKHGETFKIESGLLELMSLCRDVLSEKPLFVLLSGHTPGWTPQVLDNVLVQATAGFDGKVETGEMLLTGADDVFPLPSGTYARWTAKR